MTDFKLSTPHVRVRRFEDEEKTLEIQTTNADLVLWDRTRIKHKWPKFDEAPFLWITFLAWSAARRSGLISPDLKYEQWESDVMEIEQIEDESDDDAGRPTQEDREPD